jgi:hypothetical protein
MAIFGNNWIEDDEPEDINLFSHWKDDDDFPEPSDALKSAKERYYRHTSPYISDDFQIGPDGAYENIDDTPEHTTWDEVYSEYTGISDLHDFVEWLKNNFKTPNRL